LYYDKWPRIWLFYEFFAIIIICTQFYILFNLAIKKQKQKIFFRGEFVMLTNSCQEALSRLLDSGDFQVGVTISSKKTPIIDSFCNNITHVMDAKKISSVICIFTKGKHAYCSKQNGHALQLMDFAKN
jgi:hypothetical protein